MRKIILIYVFITFVHGTLPAKTIYDRQDSLIYEKYISIFDTKRNLPIGELTIQTAKYFLGTPYVEQTLEGNRTESLVINLRQFDCTTFVESCVALVQTIKSKNRSFENYCLQLQKLRYRNGIILNYSSRLHYISDWAYENEKRNILEDEGKKRMMGVRETKSIDFMSTHADKYPMLNENPSMLAQISKIETTINKRGGYYIVKKEHLTEVESQFVDGDIIVFATKLKGLDFSHMAFAYKNNDMLTFIHASSRAKKVIIENQSLENYCNKSNSCSGLMVLRQKNKL